MARLYEYQGKKLLDEAGVPVPKGKVAYTPEEVRTVVEEIGGAVVVKAQVWSTGRLKAGGIRFADTSEESEEKARALIGSEVKGHEVKSVLVEEKLDIDKEYYLGVIVDDSYEAKAPIVIFSTEG
ncbi:MAG: acetate--CoA ligase family protein, partial [Candidatus Bathyarchaeota archaeon]|nr:acetate--CoA ligase family protein [Candidatus Bathyarchaeota archaeon]